MGGEICFVGDDVFFVVVGVFGIEDVLVVDGGCLGMVFCVLLNDFFV